MEEERVTITKREYEALKKKECELARLKAQIWQRAIQQAWEETVAYQRSKLTGRCIPMC